MQCRFETTFAFLSTFARLATQTRPNHPSRSRPKQFLCLWLGVNSWRGPWSLGRCRGRGDLILRAVCRSGGRSALGLGTACFSQSPVYAEERRPAPGAAGGTQCGTTTTHCPADHLQLKPGTTRGTSLRTALILASGLRGM